MVFDVVSVAGTVQLPGAEAAGLQNRLLQDHLVHNSTVHCPIVEDRVDLRKFKNESKRGGRVSM